MNKLGEEEIQEILVSLKTKSQNATARAFGRSVGTVNKLAKRNGIKPLDIHAQKTEAATEARRYYAREGRLDLLEKEFDKIDELLPKVEKASQIRELALATAILIDKYRLEMPEQTGGNTPGDDGESATDQLMRMLHIDKNSNPIDSDDESQDDT